MRSYAVTVSLRKLFVILIAWSVLFAPAVTATAMAAAPHRDMQMMSVGHCQAPPAKSGDHGKKDTSCCMSMCTAMAVAPSVPGETAGPRRQVAQFVAPKAYHGLLAEIATPPPRHN